MLTLKTVIERNERWYPDVQAYVQGERVLTHRQYAQRVRKLAAALAATGLARNGRVAVLSMNSIAYCEIYGACEWAGFMAVTLNFRLAAPEIAWILADSTPAVLFFEASFAPMVATLRLALPAMRCVCIGEAMAWAEDCEALLARGDEAGPPFGPTPDDYASLIYTSGTTGRPKGVLSTQATVLATAEMLAQEMDMAAHSRSLLITPLFHVGARNVRAAQAWRYGTCVIERGFDASRLAGLVQRERINTMFLVAAQLQMLLDQPDIDSHDLSSLVTVGMAGAPIPVPLLERAIARMGRAIMVQYGMTEGQIASLYRHELRPRGTPEEIRRIGSVGHSLPHGQLRVVDERGADCAPGLPGEVWFRNASVMDGYWNNTAATLEALAGGWMRTGDIGVLDDAGYLFLIDRKKDVIISGGENIYSREVEEALHRHSDVTESAVIGIPDVRWGEAVKAYVVRKPGAAVSAAELIEFAATQIARYKCPKQLVFVDALPRLATGKVSKVALREAHRAEGR
ncbi:class I adenylate-forming enzyme family protein [Variovorax sp. PBL-E5]|uniref:class I adenylate-forming enzyme family protein n=1 Tax=Variovorax sp. PBL-E5 TaxID=434014 RepID=UPI001316A766|nr:AMP-binding protein [Variovorax sp. PBL-E5]VTU46066.1 Long-chain-fatty-acid--CoA ligase FadD13 [Variovorax sp. PBL-E5]